MANNELPTSNVLLIAGEDEEGRIAKKLLQKRQVGFVEIKDTTYSHMTEFKRPTLLVFGVPYQGLSEIKQAVDIDSNL